MIQHHPSELSKALGHKPHPARKSRGTRGQALNATNRAKTSVFLFLIAHEQTTPFRGGYDYEIRFRNSRRVSRCVLNPPNIADVVMVASSLRTPRIIIHRCCPSITTATPSGLIVS